MSIGAVGQGLKAPAQLYPTTIGLGGGISSPSPTNTISLPNGSDFLIPPGQWFISPGLYSSVQILNPVTNTWQSIANNSINGQFFVDSDGTNYRMINNTGFAVGAVVTSTGSGYTSTPTMTATGGSTWQTFIGGSVSVINVNNAGSGKNYAVPPVVHIAAPPSPGIPASAIATLSGGFVTLITLINQGAGYTSAPAVTIVPQNSDLNVASGTLTITNAGAVAVLSYVGMMTGVLLVNEGNNPLTSPPASTFAGGAGSGAAVNILMDFAMTGVTVTTPGSGYATPISVISSGGGTQTSQTSTPVNPTFSSNLIIPRQVNVVAAVGSGTGVSFNAANILDGGVFATAPNLIVIPGPTTVTTGIANVVAVLAPVLGGVNDTVIVQPAITQ